MINFTVIILLCLFALGVSLLVGNRKKNEKKEDVTGIEGAYKKNWHVFFWQSLRVLAFAFMTFFLLITMLIFYEEDDTCDAFFWLIWFMAVAWFISIPIAIVYICSIVQAVRQRNHMNNIFLGLHSFNILQLLCVAVFAVILQKECTAEAMETDFKANEKNITQLIHTTRSWLADSTGFSVEYSKHGELTDWGVTSGKEIDCQDGYGETDELQEKELWKIGLSLERLDSVRSALQKMGYRGLTISRDEVIGDYTEIIYGKDGGMEFDCQIYDKPLTDSLLQELKSRPDLVVYNRNVVFRCMEFTGDYSVFPGKESYLEKRVKSKHK
ncbi:hypothetical protein [Prevotella fusca]|uniref:Uncharacterized protein n=1 Tax=Prevotella fusca JCM 17724 TaxID=1236517 RepID=A0ABX7Y1K8_9BACT|nr:hypothetical protein [Prevotella fusca]QUB87594.1 hypothetical protein J5A51_09125 [Prevotella fusca JCM 17724]